MPAAVIPKLAGSLSSLGAATTISTQCGGYGKSHTTGALLGRWLHRQAATSTDTKSGLSAVRYLDTHVNFEARGVPNLAGTREDGVFDLRRMHRLLEQVDNPQCLFPVIHVAGTKGKGSVAALLAAMLRAGGYRVGLYTSPHLHFLGERIRTSSSPHGLDGPALDALVAKYRQAIDDCKEGPGGTLTHFEVLTALAFRHFADESQDVAVVETGLGGLTDATNVFPPQNVAATVITAMGLDHVDALGGSLRSIAAAKAGILREGRPVVLAPQAYAEAAEVVAARAVQLGCPLVRAEEKVQVRGLWVEWDTSDPRHVLRERLAVSQLVGADVAASGDGADVSSHPAGADMAGVGVDVAAAGADVAAAGADVAASGPGLGGGRDAQVQVRLVGRHQHDNVAAALATARELRGSWFPALGEEAIFTGLREAWMPCRFQVVALPPMEGGRGAHYAVLDGAHTGEAAEALAQTLREVFGPSAPLALVLAMAADKQHAAFMAALRRAAPVAAVFTAVDVAGSAQRTCPPGTLVAHWQRAAGTASGVGGTRLPRCRELIQASLAAALDKARHELTAHPGPGVLVVTGSLHAAAQAAAVLGA